MHSKHFGFVDSYDKFCTTYGKALAFADFSINNVTMNSPVNEAFTIFCRVWLTYQEVSSEQKKTENESDPNSM